MNPKYYLILFLLFAFSCIRSADFLQSIDDLEHSDLQEDQTEAQNDAALLPQLQEIAARNKLALLSQEDPTYECDEVVRLLKAERIACKQLGKPFECSKGLHAVVVAKVYSPSTCCGSNKYFCLCRITRVFCMEWFDCCCYAPSKQQVASMKDILQPENLEPDRLLLRHYNNVQREHGLMVANGIKNELKRRNDIRQVQREMENSSGVASDVAPVLPPSIVARKPSLSLAAAPIPAFRASLSHTPTSTLEGLHS